MTAALHGNEPAGVRAAEAAAPLLAGIADRLRGDVLVLLGNRTARARGVRCVDHDLNRAFTAERIAAIRGGSGPVGDTVEDREATELLRAIDAARGEPDRGPVFLADLHSSSGDGPPFLILGPGPGADAVAASLPWPAIADLVGHLRGTLVGALAPELAGAIVAESGRHDDPHTTARCLRVLGAVLLRTGIATPADLPEPLRPDGAACAGTGPADDPALPRRLRTVHRHAIAAGDAFVMRPGHQHFDPVRRGQVLAEDRHGPIRATHDGRLLLPLYQAQGEDGFFLAVEE